jgi:predicted NBD/HSP70 family sugar kinase
MELPTLNQTIQHIKEELLSRDNGKEAPAQGADFHTLREHNHLLVLNCVRHQGPIARVAIAQQTGLSKTTVSSIIDELLQDGLVSEGDLLDSSPIGGRRAILVNFNADVGIILGVEVSRTRITIAATNLNGEIKRIQTVLSEITHNPAISLPIILTSIRVFVAKSGLSWDQIIGIGIGMPATIDTQNQMLRLPAMQGWGNIDLPAILMNEFQIPAFIDNNANLGALSEGRYGIGKGISDFIYVNIGMGIGSGIIRNYQIIRGSFGTAGEIGHIRSVDDGPPCDCGNYGCLETVADERAIIEDACQGRTLQLKSNVPRQHAGSSILARYEEVDINDVIHAADSGDLASKAALQEAGKYLGVAISTLINLFNPEAIILDGNIVRSTHILMDALNESAAKSTLQTVWPKTKILIGQLGDLAVALGAATLIIDAAFAPPALIT